MDHFPIIGLMGHPFLYSQLVFLKVVNFSPDGLEFVTSSANKFFFVGMQIDLSLSVPLANQVDVKAEIRHIRSKSDGAQILIGVVFIERPKLLHIKLSEYALLTVNGISVESLREAGFEGIGQLNSSIVEYAKKEDFPTIMTLRHQSYGANNASVRSIPLENMLNAFDSFARHLIVRINSKIVCSARLIFNNGSREKVEILKYYGFHLPEEVLNKKFVEVSKLCVDPGYRKSSHFSVICQHCVKIAFETDHEYILGLSLPKQAPEYEKIGFKQIGDYQTFREHNVVLAPMLLKLTDLLESKDLTSGITADFVPLKGFLYKKNSSN